MTDTPRHEGGESRQNTQDTRDKQHRDAQDTSATEMPTDADDPRETGAIEKELQAFLNGDAQAESDLEKQLDALLPDDADDPEASACDTPIETTAETEESGHADRGENSPSEGDAESDGSKDCSWDEPEDGLWAKDEAPAPAEHTGKTQAERDAEDKKLRAESYKIMANMGNFALYLVIALVFTWFIGSAMDNFFGTTPIFTIFWIFCGIASTVLEVRKTILAAKKLGESDQK